jgi:hypothetical protein
MASRVIFGRISSGSRCGFAILTRLALHRIEFGGQLVLQFAAEKRANAERYCVLDVRGFHVAMILYSYLLRIQETSRRPGTDYVTISLIPIICCRCNAKIYGKKYGVKTNSDDNFIRYSIS